MLSRVKTVVIVTRDNYLNIRGATAGPQLKARWGDIVREYAEMTVRKCTTGAELEHQAYAPSCLQPACRGSPKMLAQAQTNSELCQSL